MEGLLTYYDFAENDRRYLEAVFEQGLVANSICSEAQNACEKYLKHLVEEYFDPQTEAEQSRKTEALRTHNLQKILKFICGEMEVEISHEEKDCILKANGYYFSARYPGEESFFVDEEDVRNCASALQACKEFTDRVVEEEAERARCDYD